MPQFLFKLAEREIYQGLLDLGAGTFYLHLVAAIPAIEASVAGQLNLASNDPAILTGLTYQPNQAWDFDDPIFPSTTNFALTAIGGVICKMAGSTPASTDRAICFSSAPMALPSGIHGLLYKFPATGLLEFGTISIDILDLQFNDPVNPLLDLANHQFTRVGTPVPTSNGAAQFDGGGMLVAPVVLDRSAINPAPATVVTPTNNDTFADRHILTGVKIRALGNNTNAGGEVGEPIHHLSTSAPTNSIWWSWTAPDSDLFVIDTVGSGLGNTILAIYTGSSIDNLTPVASNEDINNGDYQSRIQFRAIGGTTYQIAVDGYGSDTGDITLNIDRYQPTEWDFESDVLPQNLTLSIKFQLDAIGASYNGPQYLFDSRHEGFLDDPYLYHLAVRYNYDSIDPTQSYLAFEYYEFQADLAGNASSPWQDRIPFQAVAGVEHRVDLVIFTDIYDDVRPQLFIDGCYYSDNFTWLEWRLDKFAIGGSLYTDTNYPNIGDYPGYFHGQIDFAKILPGARNPVTSFAHPLTRIIDLPFATDFKDIAAWDYSVVEHGNVSIVDGRAAFTGGYLEIKANNATIPDDYDWRIRLELTVAANQVKNAVVFCRLPDRYADGSGQRNFYGSELTLIVNPTDHPGYLMLSSSIKTNKGKYADFGQYEMVSLSRIDDGLPHSIEILRTNGCKDHIHSPTVSGQPPAYRGADGYNVVRMYVDDRLHAENFGPGSQGWEERADFNTPVIYIGGFPPGITCENPAITGSGRLNGSIGYFTVDNHLPDVPRLVHLEFGERDGLAAPLDLAAHTYTNVGGVTIADKQAVFDGSNYLVASPVGSEWSIDNPIADQQYTFRIEWEFDSLIGPRPYQYLFDSRAVGGATDILSLAYHHDSVPESSFLEISIDSYAVDVLVPLHAIVGQKYRIDILLWRKGTQLRSCVFIDGAYYQDDILTGTSFDWNIDRMLVGGSLFTSTNYPNPGDYLGRLQGKIDRLKWVYGAFDPIVRHANPLTRVLDLEFEGNWLDSSAYAHAVSAVGNVQLLDRRGVFSEDSGGGYLSIANNNVLNLTPDWRLELEIQGTAFATHTDAAIICRPELNSNLGGSFILTLADRDYPGYLVYRNRLSVNTTSNQYTVGTGSAPLLKSKIPLINTGAASSKIAIVRTMGVLNRSNYQAIWMFVDGILHDVNFTAQANAYPNTPFYIGSLPPGLTSSISGAVGQGKFKGYLNYVRFSNYAYDPLLLATSGGNPVVTSFNQPTLIHHS